MKNATELLERIDAEIEAGVYFLNPKRNENLKNCLNLWKEGLKGVK